MFYDISLLRMPDINVLFENSGQNWTKLKIEIFRPEKLNSPLSGITSTKKKKKEWFSLAQNLKWYFQLVVNCISENWCVDVDRN